MEWISKTWPFIIVAVWQVAWVIAARFAIERGDAATGNIYCPRCGQPIPVERIAGACRAGVADEAVPPALPSALLRRGWTRFPALDAEGRICLPADPSAVAWSIWGAARAFDEDAPERHSYNRHLEGIVSERYGGATVEEWNYHPARRYSTVVALAEEIERRMGLRSAESSGGGADHRIGFRGVCGAGL